MVRAVSRRPLAARATILCVICSSEAATRSQIDEPLFGAYVRWSTGIIHHLTGQPARAEKDLTQAARLMSLCGRPDLADRAGLLLIDSPGKEEMVVKDFEAVVHLLSLVEERHARAIQVIVATSLPAVRGATAPEKQVFIANDDDPLFT